MKGARSVWLLAVPLVAASSVVAHALAYRLAGANAGVVPADDTHHYLAHLPLLAAPAVSIALVALTFRVVRARGAERSRPPSWTPFALAPPLGFALQEHLERLLHGGTVTAVAWEPTFVLGLALSAPLGLVAFVLVRSLLASVDRVARASALPLTWLSPPRPSAVAAVLSRRSPPTLALARPTGRGPPRPLPA